MATKRKTTSSEAPTPGECFHVAASGEERRASKRGASEPAAASLWDDPAGRSPSNTYPQSSQGALGQVPLAGRPGSSVSGGLDWFEGSLSVAFDPITRGRLIRELDAVKARCQETGVPDEYVRLLGCVDVRVHRLGINRGGERGTHYAYQISYAGITIGLGDWNAEERQADNLFVRMTGETCLLKGAWQGYDLVRELVQQLGGRILRERLTRVDLCLDVTNVAAAELQQLVEAGHFITRFKAVHPQTELVAGRRTGFTAGKSPQRLICYDKLHEQRNSYNDLYLQTLITRRYGGVEPEHALRLEAQCSRAFLLEKGIDSPADLRVKASHLFHHVCTDKFRITDRPVDRASKNQSRAAMHDLWTALVGAGEVVFGKIDGELIPVDRSLISPIRVFKQGFGCFVSGFKQMGVPITRRAELVRHVVKAVDGVMDSSEKWADFFDEYRLLLEECST